MNDAALARALASAAGKLLLRLQTDAGPRSEATADKALGDAGDRRANVLILDALRGDATLFTRADEVEQAWRIVDPVIAAWESNEVPLEPYVAGTPGPAAADALIRADGRKWRRL